MIKKSLNIKKYKIKLKNNNQVLSKNTTNPLWLSISESAKLGGVNPKTIRRAIQANKIRYKIVKNRYIVGLSSVIVYLYSKRKLKNKLNQFGLGQYIDKWRK